VTLDLTKREGAALQALIDKRAVYAATGHKVAAGVMWIAISLVRQVFERVDLDGQDAKDTQDTVPE
jgi:hypothetical protein